MYLSHSMMNMLEPKLRALAPGTRIVVAPFSDARLAARRAPNQGGRSGVVLVDCPATISDPDARVQDERSKPHYADVITPDAIRALEALAPLRQPSGSGDGRAHRSGARARGTQAAASRFSIPARRSAARRSRCRTRATATSPAARFRADLQRQWIQGTGPAARPGATVETGLRNVAYALLSRRRRLDVRRRRRARPGVDDVARQPAEPEAGDSPRSGVPEGGRTGGGRNEPVGHGLLRAADRRRLAQAARVHDQDLPRPRPAPRRPADPPRRRRRLLGLDRRRHALRRQQPPAADASRAPRSCCICRRSRPPKKPRCGTTF